MKPELSRRGLFALFLTLSAAPLLSPANAKEQASPLDDLTTTTLEAFADTVIPGEKRHADDVAIAGVVAGPGAVQAGFTDLIAHPSLGLAPLLPGLAVGLNTRAEVYALTHLVALPALTPPMAGLPFQHRTGLLAELLDPVALDGLLWGAVALVAQAAFTAAAHADTVAALRDGHPGLAWTGYPQPDPDGLWRSPGSSYRSRLAASSVHALASGNPR